MKVLTQPQIYQFLDTTNGWTYEQGMLTNTYEFDSFLEAVGFVNDLAEVAEQLAHHPDIFVQQHKVTLTTVTQAEEQQVTDLDTTLVEAIEELVE